MLPALCAIAACAAGGADPTRPDTEQFVELHGYGGPLALIHAHVLTMDNGSMIERDQTVFIRDGRIVAVGRTGEMAPPADAGAPIMAGTDAGVPAVEPGSSLHDELAELIAAGLSPYDALATATVSPARFLGLDGQVGVVKAGARADLVLLSANPLEDLHAARSPAGVVLRGRLLVPALIR